MKTKRVLVVGGAGFIGSTINQMLYRAGYETVVFDNLSRGYRAAVRAGTFVEGDLGDAEALEKLFKQHHFDAVMHFAALIDVGESVRDPAAYYLNNVAYTLQLLQTMVRHNVKTLIFSSSAAIYGVPHEIPLTEQHPCSPINPYGETKWMVEKILQDFDAAYGLKSCCLRYFNAAGGDPLGEVKHPQLKSGNLIPLVLRSLKTAGQIKINGTDYATPDGTCVRDYIHIDDLGAAHIRAMEKLWQGGASAAYNLGNGQGFSVKEVIRAAEKVTGKRVNAVEGPRRPGDPAILVADASKAARELGWRPRYPELEMMITHAWEAINV